MQCTRYWDTVELLKRITPRGKMTVVRVGWREVAGRVGRSFGFGQHGCRGPSLQRKHAFLFACRYACNVITEAVGEQ
eukprot:2079195-Pyramimonas_sp.AAC.1